MRKPKYKVGDIVGVCADGMYEFEITHPYGSVLNDATGKPSYGGKCVGTHGGKAIKKGDVYAISPKQIVVRLGENGKMYPQTSAKEAAALVLGEKKPSRRRAR